ncbi:MAG: ATP-binding protein [Lachnospiraceae bacterium]|nr:ATP-binding protein [Lachnospiraceae bacterium]
MKSSSADNRSNMQLTTHLLFRLLPMQIILAMIGSINSIISGLFATNYVGTDAMAAVGVYNPINMLVYAISTMLVGGAVILCGMYMGRNEPEKVQNVFTLGNVLAIGTALVFAVLFVVMSTGNMTGFLTDDPAIRPYFDRYLLGQAIGLAPLLLGNQFAAFLSLENKAGRTMLASVVYIIVNVILNFVFVAYLHMESFGLALASAIGLWVYLLIQAVCFMSPASELKIISRGLSFGETGQIIKIGIPGAASYGYQTLRGFIVNKLLLIYVGAAGLSAFTSSDNLLRIAWALPGGMLAASRMVMSISIGEEDRQTLADVMRVMFRRFLPLMSAVSALIIISGNFLAKLYYQDTTDPVYMMTVWGFRILPLCMPLSIICMHFTVYAQSSGKQVLVHLLSILDGVVCVAGFTALLIPRMGMNSVYVANVLNGVVTTIVIVAYSIIRIRRIPKTMDELMVIPEEFGVTENERMDLSVKKIEDVENVSVSVKEFCDSRGIDPRSSYLASLFLEEMAGNVVDHGFTKDKKNHSIDIRVVHKNDDLILRIKDDCVPFDPAVKRELRDPSDPAKNIGIRMIYKLAEHIEYQNMLGLNVLTVRLTRSGQ